MRYLRKWMGSVRMWWRTKCSDLAENDVIPLVFEKFVVFRAVSWYVGSMRLWLSIVIATLIATVPLVAVADGATPGSLGPEL
jgi:hypothetical protein